MPCRKSKCIAIEFRLKEKAIFAKRKNLAASAESIVEKDTTDERIGSSLKCITSA